MVLLIEKKEPPGSTALRFLPKNPGAPGDRVARWLLTIGWPQYLAVIAGFYLVAATLFAEGLVLIGGLSAGQSASFADAFFMSLQALTVFGCGRLMPVTPIAKGLAASAIFVGWLALVLLLALTMVRFILLRPLWRPDGRFPLEEPSEKEEPPSRAQASN